MISPNFSDYKIKGTKNYSTPDGLPCMDISYQNKKGFGFCVSVSRAYFFDDEEGNVLQHLQTKFRSTPSRY